MAWLKNRDFSFMPSTKDSNIFLSDRYLLFPLLTDYMQAAKLCSL